MKKKYEINKNKKYNSDELNPNLKVSPWSGHRDFAYDLINYLEPEKIVELGTHYGCSFFTFLQAIKDNQLNTHVTAIDTWQGDEQAGFYSEDVFKLVNETLNTYFDGFKYELKRMFFDDANKEFDNSSIDLIHIDGLHTYEAVSNDYIKWLPKLKNNGIILFHDVASELEYGSNKFWEELKKLDIPYLEFNHSWGLGVLFPKGDYLYKELIKENIQDKMMYYYQKSENDLNCLKVRDLNSMIKERDKAITSMETMIIERDKAITSMETMIKERDKAITSMETMIKERDAIIKQFG